MGEAGRARDGRPAPVEVVTGPAYLAGLVAGERAAADDRRPRRLMAARRRAERLAERVEARQAAVRRVEALEAGRLLVGDGGSGGGGRVGRRGRHVRAHRGRARQSIQRT